MKTENFVKLIQAITGRDFEIKTADLEILPEKEYYVFRTLPITGRVVGFNWKTAKTDEKLLKGFITTFCSKYKEPNPRAYDYSAKTYGEKYKWENKSEYERECAYYHHSSNMFSKESLMQQIEANFNLPEIENTMKRYGFYPTEYGIGIFVLFNTDYVKKACNSMAKYLQGNNVPYTNEFSEAGWVLRFKIGISKPSHEKLLGSF